MHCGRCKQPVTEHEFCWYCTGPLCAPCWEEHGHCGEPGAELHNIRANVFHLANGLREVGHRYLENTCRS